MLLAYIADCAKRMAAHLKTAFKLFQAVIVFMDSEKLASAGMTSILGWFGTEAYSYLVLSQRQLPHL